MSLQKLKDEKVIGIMMHLDKRTVAIHDACCYKFKTILTKWEVMLLINDLSQLHYEMED